MAQKSQEKFTSHATNSSTFSQGTGPYDIKMKTIGVCVWAVNFHFFPDFDVADGTGAVQCGFPITLFLSFCCASRSRDVVYIQFLVVGFLLKTIQKTSAVSAQANPGRSSVK